MQIHDVHYTCTLYTYIFIMYTSSFCMQYSHIMYTIHVHYYIGGSVHVCITAYMFAYHAKHDRRSMCKTCVCTLAGNAERGGGSMVSW